MKSKLDYTAYEQFFVEVVCSLYNKTHEINKILEVCPGFHYNEIVSILAASGISDIELRQFNLKDRKVMLISDTHYGSVYDNIKYAYHAFDFAKANGIKTILHGGDILEGSVRAKVGYGSEDQAEYFIKNYPHDKDIITKAILGNHDYMAISSLNKTMDILESREDINILGFKKIFFDWYGKTIGLQHEVKKYKLCYPAGSFHEDLNFKGHSHAFNIKEYEQQEHICIPALCDDPISINTSLVEDENALKPGFLIAEHCENYIMVTHYFFDNKKINKGKVHANILKK